MSLPLSDARTARIGHYHRSDAPEIFQYSVSFGGAAYLFRTRVYYYLPFNRDILLVSLARNRSRTAQVLI